MNVKKELTGGLLALILCAAVALGALAFVPSSPALMLDEAETLLEFDTGLMTSWGDPVPLMVTKYGACIAGGAVAAALLLAAMYRLHPTVSAVKDDESTYRLVRSGSLVKGAAVAALCGVFALLGSHWLFCAVRWGYIINDLAGDWSFPLQLWQGGFTMYGAILGALLGGLVASKLTKDSLASTMDRVVLGLAVVLIAGRLGEFFTSQGIANERAAEALSMLPFRKVDFYGEARLAINVYEALAAVAALIAAAVVMLRRQPAGRAAEVALAIVSAWQILFESLRGDETIKFGFVLLNMIAAAAVMAFILVTRIIRRVKKQGWRAWETWRVVLFAVGAVIVICTEFALDGKIKLPVNNTFLYAVDALAVTGMMLSVAIADGRKEGV